jgi:hypothetical protein
MYFQGLDSIDASSVETDFLGHSFFSDARMGSTCLGQAKVPQSIFSPAKKEIRSQELTISGQVLRQQHGTVDVARLGQ